MALAVLVMWLPLSFSAWAGTDDEVRADEVVYLELMEDLSLIFEDVGSDCPVLIATLDDWLDRHGAQLEEVGPPVLARAATSVATSRRVEGTVSPLLAPVTAARGRCVSEAAVHTFSRLDGLLTTPSPHEEPPPISKKERKRLLKRSTRFTALMSDLDERLHAGEGDCAVVATEMTRWLEKRGAELGELSGDYYTATVEDGLPQAEQDLLVDRMRGPTLRLLELSDDCGGHAAVARGWKDIQAVLVVERPR